jgi:hypothetical protein
MGKEVEPDWKFFDLEQKLQKWIKQINQEDVLVCKKKKFPLTIGWLLQPAVRPFRLILFIFNIENLYTKMA